MGKQFGHEVECAILVEHGPRFSQATQSYQRHAQIDGDRQTVETNDTARGVLLRVKLEGMQARHACRKSSILHRLHDGFPRGLAPKR